MSDLKFDICLATEAKERGGQVKEDALRWNYANKLLEFWNGSEWADTVVHSKGANWIRLRFGLQLCWESLDNVAGEITTTPFPVGFKSAPVLADSVLWAQSSYPASNRDRISVITAVTKDNFSHYAVSAAGTSSSVKTNYIAIGWWQ